MVIDEADKGPRVKRIVITSQWRLPLLLDGNYVTSEALVLFAFHRYRGIPFRYDPRASGTP